MAAFFNFPEGAFFPGRKTNAFSRALFPGRKNRFPGGHYPVAIGVGLHLVPALLQLRDGDKVRDTLLVQPNMSLGLASIAIGVHGGL